MSTSSSSTASSTFRYNCGDPVVDLLSRVPKHRVWSCKKGGGPGLSYEAADPRHKTKDEGRLVTLKLISRGEDVNGSLEVEILQHLRLLHPHIVAIREVYLTRHHLAIVMDHIPGRSVRQIMEQRGPRGYLWEHQACAILQAVVATVGFCHQKGIFHLNISPEAILLHGCQILHTFQIPQGCQIKLSEFAHGDSRAGFEAPETRRGLPHHRHCGRRADVWSCGALLQTMVMGHGPLEQGDEQKDRERWSSISANCKNLMQGMLAENPEERLSVEAVLAHPFFHQIPASRDYQAINASALRQNPNERPHSQSKESIKRIIHLAKHREQETSSEEDDLIAMDPSLMGLIRR